MKNWILTIAENCDEIQISNFQGIDGTIKQNTDIYNINIT